MEKIKVLAICGKSGAGKDTLLRKFLEWTQQQKEYIPCKKVSLAATRPRREGETLHNPYHFISEEEYKEKEQNREIKYSTCFNNWYYGVEVEALAENQLNIGVFNPTMLQMMIDDPTLDVGICYVDTNDKNRLTRSLMRETNPDCQEICRRFLADTINDKPIFEYLKTQALIIMDGNYYFNDASCRELFAALASKRQTGLNLSKKRNSSE